MLSRRLATQAPAWLGAARGAAAKAGPGSSAVATASSPASPDGITTTVPGQAFVGDLRSTSALCLADGINTHTQKWLQVRCGGRGRAGGGGWNGCELS